MQRIATSDGVAQIDGLAHHIAIDGYPNIGEGEFIRSGNGNVISFQRPRSVNKGLLPSQLENVIQIAQHNRISICFSKTGEG